MNFFEPRDFDFIATELRNPERKLRDVFEKTYIAEKTIFILQGKGVYDEEKYLDWLFLTEEEADESARSSPQNGDSFWSIRTDPTLARIIISDWSRCSEREAALRLLVEILNKSGAPYTFYDLLFSPIYEHLLLSRTEWTKKLLDRLQTVTDDGMSWRSVPELASGYDYSPTASVDLAKEIAGRTFLYLHPRFMELAKELRTHIFWTTDVAIENTEGLVKYVSSTVASLLLWERSEVSDGAVFEMVKLIYGDNYEELPIISKSFREKPSKLVAKREPNGIFEKILHKIAPSKFEVTYDSFNMKRYPELERLGRELTVFLKDWIQSESISRS